MLTPSILQFILLILNSFHSSLFRNTWEVGLSPTASNHISIQIQWRVYPENYVNNSQQINEVRFNAFLHTSTLMHYDKNIATQH